MSTQANPIPFWYINNYVKFKNPSWSVSAAPRPTFPTQKYKGFLKFIKGKTFHHVLYYFYFKTILLGKIGSTGVNTEVHECSDRTTRSNNEGWQPQRETAI